MYYNLFREVCQAFLNVFKVLSVESHFKIQQRGNVLISSAGCFQTFSKIPRMDKMPQTHKPKNAAKLAKNFACYRSGGGGEGCTRFFEKGKDLATSDM
jgi:hypothetical protein